MLPKVSVSLI